LPKDKIIFECRLENQNIEYYSDIENQPMFENIGYFILDADRIKLDKIFYRKRNCAHEKFQLELSRRKKSNEIVSKLAE
jgi:hypothetical protein